LIRFVSFLRDEWTSAVMPNRGKETTMRKFGYALLVTGIVVEVLMLMITFGTTDSVSHVSLGYGLYMIIGGWQLIKHGKGIGPQQKKSASNQQCDISLAPAEDSSREVPITSEISELIQRRMQRSRKVRLIITLSAGLFGAGFVVATALAAGASNPPIIMLYALGAGLLLGSIIGAAMSFDGVRLRRDSHELTYLRSSGPVKLVKMKFGYILRLADRALFVDPKQSKPLRNLDWATIDYSRNAKLIFSVWDRSGKLIYRLAGTES
jgi:hypothetical protein